MRHVNRIVLWLLPCTLPTQDAPGPRPAGRVRGGAKQEHLANVRGRCVAAEAQTPLGGCKVQFSGWHRRTPTDPDAIVWQDPEAVVTDAEGRFVIWFIPSPEHQHALDVQCEGRVPRTARWTSFAAGQSEDLGDISLPRGRRVRGTVVDAAGEPVPRVTILIGGLPLPIRDGMNANTERGAMSDDRGQFTLTESLPEGSWPLRVSTGGLVLVAPAKATVAGDDTALRVVVRAVPSIAGHVFDDAARPRGRVYIEARDSGEDGMQVAAAWSRVDGTFSLWRPEHAPDSVRLAVIEAGDCEPKDMPDLYDWGANAIRIELQRALSRELTVVEKDTARPVERYTVRCHATRARSSPFYEARLGGRHEHGVVRVDKVWRGENRIAVIPEDPALAPTADRTFTATPEGVPPMRIEVERLVPLEVRVLDSGGDPNGGVCVQAIDWRGLPAEFPYVSDPRGGNVPIGDVAPVAPVVLSSAVTDKDGNARVYVRRDHETIVRAIRAPSWILARTTLPAAPANGERLVLQSTSSKPGK